MGAIWTQARIGCAKAPSLVEIFFKYKAFKGVQNAHVLALRTIHANEKEPLENSWMVLMYGAR